MPALAYYLCVCLCLARLLEVLYFLPHSPHACSSLLDPPDPGNLDAFEMSALTSGAGLNSFFFAATTCRQFFAPFSAKFLYKLF
jgi:hypothetical protein